MPAAQKYRQVDACLVAGVSAPQPISRGDHPRRARYTITFQEENVGMRCWVICSYGNTNGEGPESAPLEFVVP